MTEPTVSTIANGLASVIGLAALGKLYMHDIKFENIITLLKDGDVGLMPRVKSLEEWRGEVSASPRAVASQTPG